MSDSTFSRWLQVRLDRKGWKQADLVRRGFSSAAVSNWITGERKPDPIYVKELCEALDADILSAYRVLGWLDDSTADSPMQADLIATIRRRNIDDYVAGALLASLNALAPAEGPPKRK